jgi:hypothetical protein
VRHGLRHVAEQRFVSRSRPDDPSNPAQDRQSTLRPVRRLRGEVPASRRPQPGASSRARDAPNVLVLYHLLQHPVRTAVRDHLLAIERHSDASCFPVNLAVRRIPRWARTVPFDLVVLHTTLLSALRWTPSGAPAVARRVLAIRDLPGVRVALPQDDFLRSDRVAELLGEIGVDHVFTPVPEHEWPKVYRRLDRSRVALHHALTGYLEPHDVAVVEAHASDERPIDIGYRAWHAAPWLGRHGQLKTEVARVVGDAARRRGLRVDVSTRAGDTLFGDDWLRFLGSCKYTLGVEGGASVLDHDGTVKARTERYLAEHPDASFEQVEAACFPGRDGELELSALSPRHLESAASRTCQILVEGHYDGVLEPDVHYIPLRPDFSNVEEVLDRIVADRDRAGLVERAHRDVVASGRWTYARFVEDLLETALGNRPPAGPAPSFALRAGRAADRASWALVVAIVRLWTPMRGGLLGLVPRGLRSRLARAYLWRVEQRSRLPR